MSPPELPPRLTLIADRASLPNDAAWIGKIRALGAALNASTALQIELRRPKQEASPLRLRAFDQALQALNSVQAPRLQTAVNAHWDEIDSLPADVLIHLPEASLAAGDAVPSSRRIAASVHTLDAAFRAFDLGVQFVRFGPILAPSTKPIAGVGFDALRAFCTEAPGPVVAVGGLDRGHGHALIAAGAAGAAVVGAALRSPDCASWALGMLGELDAAAEGP